MFKIGRRDLRRLYFFSDIWD